MTTRPDAATGTVLDLFRPWSQTTPSRPAILAPDAPPLTYRDLLRQVDWWGVALARVGLRRDARIGIALPPGPETAVTLIATCSLAVCAPLRPDSPPTRLARDAHELALDLVVTSPDRLAELRDLGVTATAGLDQLPDAVSDATPGHAARYSDVALVLRTSGTTGEPKRVPLSQANLWHSARNIARSLQLTPADRCLNVMPLWHVHGLVAGLLATLASGGSVICPPEFSAPAFLDWLEKGGATWYSAVPTMHRSILSALDDSGVPAHGLRFVRSASAPLPATVIAAVEEAFGVPVIEAYGMTEAAHQIAASPLPPAARKRGSVGVGTGVRVAVVGASDERLAADLDGEIVIRGPNVFAGYDGAGTEAFVNGWFRTGDRGHLDADGHLHITGRIREMINRAGETIAPREIDESLLEHPDVVDAAAFGMPQERLGEAVAAAVVLRVGASVTGAQLREFTATRLPLSAVPIQVLIVAEIPRTATGKLRRADLDALLAGRLRPDGHQPSPATDITARLGTAWARLLGVRDVAPGDSLSTLGIDSLLTARMVNRIEAWWGVRVPLVDLFLADTVAEQARLISLLTTGALQGPGNTDDAG